MAKENNWMLQSDRDLLAARFEKKRLAWERASRHGIFRFVFVQWVLRFGGIAVLSQIIFRGYLNGSVLHQPDVLRRLAFATLISLVLTILLGIWDWNVSERRYGTKIAERHD